MHILILTCAYLKPNMPIKRLTCPRSRRSADHPLPSARLLPHLRQIALIQQIKSLYMAAMKYTAQLDNMNIPLSRLQHMVWQKYVRSESDSTMCACTNNKNHSSLPPSCPAHLLVSPIILQVIAHYIPLAPNLVLRTMHCNAIEGSI